MDWITLGVGKPAWLLMLVLLPVVWWIGRRSLQSLNWPRRLAAQGLRAGVLLLLILALAEVQWQRITSRIAAIFLVDQSLSLSPEQRERSFDYLRTAVAAHRSEQVGDLAGVIVFGGEAQIEQPPLPTSSMPPRRETSFAQEEHTNIAAALRLARAAFPEGAARRVVVLSDGNQNVGDALQEGRVLADDGVSIDVAPLVHQPRADVLVEKVSSPADARPGAPFDVSVVLINRPPPEPARPRPVAGKLMVVRKTEGRSELLAEERVSVLPGKQAYTFRQDLLEPAFYTFEARFVPDDPATEHFLQNNQASSFTQLRGKGRVLLITSSEHSQEFDSLAQLLRQNEIEVTIQPASALFTSLAELQTYDSVILANVPRTSIGNGEQFVQFSDAQLEMLVRNVEQLGAGLVMIGGPESFGAGDWANTSIEKAMPVDFQIKNAKVSAVTALMLVIDKSGSMAGEKLQMSIAAAKAAVESLLPTDQIGVIAFDSAAEEIVPLRPIGDKPHRVLKMIDRLASGGGTNLEPGMRRGYEALERSKASVRHMIVLTDGQTMGSGFEQMASSAKAKKISTSSIAVGPDAARGLLQQIAARGGGKYFQVVNPKALPRIIIHETRRVARPLIFEDPQGFPLRKTHSHEILSGIDGPIPPITGFVMTTLKENPLVEAPLVAPRQPAPHNTLLATWNYGLGRSVAITTDGGQRWTQGWAKWEGQEKLFVQAIRWSMRPAAGKSNFTIATTVKDGRLQVVVHGLSASGEFVNGASLSGSLIREGGEPAQEFDFRQTGPGRYTSDSELPDAGSYLLAVHPGPGEGLLRAGVNVPYSAEFRENEANENLLISLASLHAPSVPHGEIIRLPEEPRDWHRFAGPNIFRRDLPRACTVTDAWPLALLLGAFAFLFDVANRRLYFGSLPQRVLAFVSRPSPVAPVYSAGLPARTLAAARFEADGFGAEPSADNESGRTMLPELANGDETYSSRLLRAKRAARATR